MPNGPRDQQSSMPREGGTGFAPTSAPIEGERSNHASAGQERRYRSKSCDFFVSDWMHLRQLFHFAGPILYGRENGPTFEQSLPCHYLTTEPLRPVGDPGVELPLPTNVVTLEAGSVKVKA